MGVDKALLTIDGETMLERAVRTALETGLQVAVSGRKPPENWALPAIPFIPDLTPFKGPLHGITRLLEHFWAPVLAIGCDMPLVTSRTLAWLIDQRRRHTGEDGTAVMDSAGVIQPLFSIYTPALLSRLETISSDEAPSVRAVIEAGRFERITVPVELESALESVDTPEEFAFLREGSTSNHSPSSI